CPQRLLAHGRKCVERIAHSILPVFSCRYVLPFCVGLSIVPMLAFTLARTIAFANIRSSRAISRPSRIALDRSTHVFGLRHRAGLGRVPLWRDRRISDGELPQLRRTRRVACRNRGAAPTAPLRTGPTGRARLSEPDRAPLQCTAR